MVHKIVCLQTIEAIPWKYLSLYLFNFPVNDIDFFKLL